MKKKRSVLAATLAATMFATTCCGSLIACGKTTTKPADDGVYTITFDARGGTVNPASAKTVKGKLSDLPTPERSGEYEFAGWFLDVSCSGTKLTVDYKYSSNSTIYAKWDGPALPIVEEYTVTFDAGLGVYSGAATQKTVDHKLTSLTDPTPPENHRFLGWFTAQTGGNRVTTSYPFNGDNENVTLYARYAQEFVIAFDAGAGTVTETSRLTYEGKLVDALPIPKAPTGYSFIGWYTQAEGGTRVSTATEFNASGTIYAQYDAIEYNVAFDANGGTLAEGTTAVTTVGGKITALPDDPTPPEKHRFLGWFTAQTGGNRVTTAFPFTGEHTDITVYARYQREYLITFNAGEGTVTETSRLTYEGVLKDALPTPTAPEGTRFAGWWTQAEGGDRVGTAYTFTEDSEIFAHYESTSVEYNVTFDANGGTLAEGTTTVTTVDGKIAALPDDPTPPEKHRFLGWFTAQTGGNRVTTAFPFSGAQTEITLYAHYAREYLVTFNAGAGTVSETSRLTHEGVLKDALPTPTAPTGYGFEGWYTAAEGGDRVGTAYTFTDDKTIYAHYKLVEYIITFDARDGSFEEEVAPVMTVDCLLTTLPTPTPPTANHVFLGWFADDGDQQIRITSNYTFHKDVHELTVYALYREEFIVTFDANGGAVSEASRRTDNGVLKDALPTPTAPEGYRFVGWFTAKTGGTQVSTSTEFKAAATIYARYEEIIPVVTLTLNGEDAIAVKATVVVAPETAKYQYTLATGGKIALSADDVLTFLIDGSAPAKTSGRSTNHGVEISGNRITVLADGEFTFYLRYYEADGTNDPCWEVEMTDGKTDEFVVGDYYLVGTLSSWQCGASYHLGTTSGTITRKLDAGTEFKVVKCKDSTGAPNWDVESYGYSAISVGMGYAESSGGNIKIKKTGTYTIAFANGKISISSSDVEEDLNVPYSVEVTFKDNVKVTLIFDMPTNWGLSAAELNSGVITLNGTVKINLKSSGATDAVDASSIDASSVTVKVEFKQGSATKNGSGTVAFENGKTYMLGWSDPWIGDKFTLTCNGAKL